jgi:hypothetical protein
MSLPSIGGFQGAHHPLNVVESTAPCERDNPPVVDGNRVKRTTSKKKSINPNRPDVCSPPTEEADEESWQKVQAKQHRDRDREARSLVLWGVPHGSDPSKLADLLQAQRISASCSWRGAGTHRHIVLTFPSPVLRQAKLDAIRDICTPLGIKVVTARSWGKRKEHRRPRQKPVEEHASPNPNPYNALASHPAHRKLSTNQARRLRRQKLRAMRAEEVPAPRPQPPPREKQAKAKPKRKAVARQLRDNAVRVARAESAR